MSVLWGPYKNAAGERVPRVSTIISRFKESGGLVHWAWQLGMDGKDYKAVRDEAADAGTCAHAMIEAFIKSQPFVRQGWGEDVLAKADSAFAAFQTWAAGTRLEPHASEVRMVSEQLRVGGTCDAVIKINGQLAIGDWKTGSLYADHLYQVAAYSMLWEETHPDEPITGGYHLLRFSRENADFGHSYFGELEGAKRGFLLMRELYSIDAALKKRAK